jgi:hypothetical protein
MWFMVLPPRFKFFGRVEQSAARRVHTQEVAGSSPASATNFSKAIMGLVFIGYPAFPSLFEVLLDGLFGALPLGRNFFRRWAFCQFGHHRFVELFAAERQSFSGYQFFDAFDHWMNSPVKGDVVARCYQHRAFFRFFLFSPAF